LSLLSGRSGSSGMAGRKRRRLSPMSPDRPVRLTFPSNDIGYARIMADGLQVGNALKGTRLWRAFLWAHAEDRHGGYADAPVTGERLSDIRTELRERVEMKGPWWVLGDEERSNEESA
jgi:hypothetical protein